MMDRRRMFLVGWDSIFLRWLSARCLPFQFIKESRPDKSGKIMFTIICPSSHTRSPAVLASVIKSARTVCLVILQKHSMSDQTS